jgi:hypothetical protein
MINAVKPKSINYPVPIVGEVEYPNDFMDELEAEAELAPLQPYITLEELNRKYGVELKK